MRFGYTQVLKTSGHAWYAYPADLSTKISTSHILFLYTAGGLKYWKRTDSERVASDSYYRREPSASVEMTSYALLAYLISDDKDIMDARPVVRWMNTQRSALGGYSSTQVSCIH